MGRGRKKAYEREEVLANVMELFWKKGFDGSSFDDIVKTTGLNRFSLYNEFGDKEQIFEDALGLYLSKLKQTFMPLNREPYGLANIKIYFESLDMSFFKNSCFMLNTLVSKPSVPRAAFTRAAKVSREFEELIHKNLAAARERGELGEERDVTILTALLVTLDLGLVLYNLGAPNNDLKDKMVALLISSIAK